MTSKSVEKHEVDVHMSKTEIIKIQDIILLPVLAMRDLKKVEVKELAESIAKHGLLNPLLVRAKGKKYELISGHRRYLALKEAKINVAPARVIEVDDREAFILAMTENLERKDPEPMEEAEAFARAVNELKMQVKDIAQQIGKSEPYVHNAIKLTKMPKAVQSAIRKGTISKGMCEHGFFKLKHAQDHAQLLTAITSTTNDPFEEAMTVRDVEEFAKELAQSRQKIEDLAEYRRVNKDKIKFPKCPHKGCNKEPSADHQYTQVKKNSFCCGQGWNHQPWNPLTGEILDPYNNLRPVKKEKAKTSQVSVLDGRPTGDAREPQSKQEAQGHHSQYTVEEFAKVMANAIINSKAILRLQMLEEYGYRSESVKLEITVDPKKIKAIPLNTFIIEPLDLKKNPYWKTKVQIADRWGADNKEVLKARDDLWALELKMGKKPPAEIIRVPLLRVVLEGKAMSKGKDLIVDSGKYKGIWTILAVHRDYTARVKAPDGCPQLLEEKEFRALIRAAFPEKIKKKKKSKKAKKRRR